MSNTISINGVELQPFTKNMWYGFAGAESFYDELGDTEDGNTDPRFCETVIPGFGSCLVIVDRYGIQAYNEDFNKNGGEENRIVSDDFITTVLITGKLTSQMFRAI
jgi:hypothetical protein